MYFELTTIGQYATVQGGYAFKSKDFQQSGYLPVLKIKNVRHGYVEYSDCAYVNMDIALACEKWRTSYGDILISMTGSGPSAPESLVGRVARVWESEPTALINQRVGKLVLKEGQAIDKDFLFYVLTQKTSQEFLVSNATGSANQVNISSATIESVPCPNITYRESHQISCILNMLNQRERLLRETNATLEAIAQALFKSWFVDFEPVHARARGEQLAGLAPEVAALFPDCFEEPDLGMVPKGWSLSPLSEAYEINPTRKLKKGEMAPYLDMASVATSGHTVAGVADREMGSGTKFINGDTLLARITPCLENGKTAFVDFLAQEQTGWGSTEFVVLRPKAPLPTYHGYLLARHPAFREHAIQSMSGTSGRQRVQNDVLGRYLVTVPSEKVAMAFNDVISPLQQKITENHRQAQTLANLRDTLLPRLISGQLRLPDAEQQLKDLAV
ncbi:restriction endonuclease subunit S [Aeromonas sp. FDAARGOS 1414]|uniref:restriction endonuclease subunit S n=1 Tax=unclassified Aeromonas TaxID=257493 RepID=UPI001C22D0B1|nr:restriction endonuclease subunit S [Aeromonas sp. FDAARGOS 1414]QWZ79560.1 restriction endonuclease subunit S [Aeromonas sp. FDAARGOS 1414]